MLLLILVYFQGIRKVREANRSTVTIAPTKVKATASAPVVAIAAPIVRAKNYLSNEAIRMGRVSPDPIGDGARINQFASTISQEEAGYLKGQALNRDAKGNARFLSAYLLAQNHSGSTTDALAAVATAPIPKDARGRGRSLEQNIRAQGIEGLRGQPDRAKARAALKKVIEESDDSFLVDRAQRVLYSMRSGRSVADQDKAALAEVLRQ